MLPFAPGSRAIIRDEEWLIRRVDPTTDGGWLLSCDGISELVRGQSALFLTELEGKIEVLDPAQTQLVPDTSRGGNLARQQGTSDASMGYGTEQLPLPRRPGKVNRRTPSEAL